MNGWMEQWLLGVACASLILVVTGALVQGGSGKRLCKLVGSLLLLLVTMAPVLRLDQQDWEELLQWDTQIMEEAEQALSEQNNMMYESIIEQETQAYILDKAEALGVQCQVEVVVQWEDEIPKPWWVRVEGTWDQEQKERLSGILEEELGIPQQRQSFEVVEG